MAAQVFVLRKSVTGGFLAAQVRRIREAVRRKEAAALDDCRRRLRAMEDEVLCERQGGRRRAGVRGP